MISEYVNYIALAVAVAAVVYGYVKNKSANEVLAELTKGGDEALKLQAQIVTTLIAMKDPLDKAIKQLPKTRSKRSAGGAPEPPEAA